MVTEVLGLPAAKVVVHNHLIGGGFACKLDANYVETAASTCWWTTWTARSAAVKSPTRTLSPGASALSTS